MTFDYAAQPKEELKTCPLCGRGKFITAGDWDRYGLPVRSVRCEWCGLVFLNPRMTWEAYRAFYRDGHYRALVAPQAASAAAYIEGMAPSQLAYAERLIRFLRPHFKARRLATMLDIGGSTGVVAEAVVEAFGCEGSILEPSEAEIRRALSRGLRVIAGTIEEYEPDGERFDLVLLCQTMDHLVNMSGSLRTIRALLEDDGLFFADIVAGGPVKIDHPYYLSRDTAVAFFERVGLEVLAEGLDGRHYNFACGRA